MTSHCCAAPLSCSLLRIHRNVRSRFAFVILKNLAYGGAGQGHSLEMAPCFVFVFLDSVFLHSPGLNL